MDNIFKKHNISVWLMVLKRTAETRSAEILTLKSNIFKHFHEK